MRVCSHNHRVFFFFSIRTPTGSCTLAFTRAQVRARPSPSSHRPTPARSGASTRSPSRWRCCARCTATRRPVCVRPRRARSPSRCALPKVCREMGAESEKNVWCARVCQSRKCLAIVAMHIVRICGFQRVSLLFLSSSFCFSVEKSFAKLDFDLAPYAQNMNGSSQISCSFSKCSDKNARITFTIRATWMKELDGQECVNLALMYLCSLAKCPSCNCSQAYIISLFLSFSFSLSLSLFLSLSIYLSIYLSLSHCHHVHAFLD
jgi:hypothetical protein